MNETCKDLIGQLRSGDPEVQREAAFHAGENACEEAVADLADLLRSPNLGVQEAADAAMRRIGGSGAVRAVIPLLRIEEAPARNLAMDILREIGNQDFAALVELLHDNDPDVRIFASDILGSTDNAMAISPLCEAMLKDPEVNVRYQAAVSLGDLGRRDAAKCLNKALNDEEWVQFAVIEALSKIRDDSSVDALLKAMGSCSDLVASMIVEALGEMGNVKAVAMLLKKLDESPTALRNKIVKAVVRILGGKSLTLLSAAERDKFRQYLLVALEDSETDIQDAAMLGLGFVGGGPASGAVLATASAMDADRDADRLDLAVQTLSRIGLTAELEQGLRRGDPAAAGVAVAALMRMTQDQDQAAALLMDVFWDKDRDTQRAIIEALKSHIGPDTRDFFLDVLERHGDGTVIKGALALLGDRYAENEVGEVLYGYLDHPYDDVKEAALDACVAVGGEVMTRRFRELFASEEPVDRLMAVYAMGRMDVPGNLEELTAALEDEVPDIRKVALEGLSSLCFDDFASWLDTVAPCLADENREVRLTVVDLMGNCPNGDVLPHLMAALDDHDDWVRVRAIEALGHRAAEVAVPRLVAAMADENKMVAIRAVEALGAIGGQSAFRSLLAAVEGDDPEMQAAAEEALERMQENGVES